MEQQWEHVYQIKQLKSNFVGGINFFLDSWERQWNLISSTTLTLLKVYMSGHTNGDANLLVCSEMLEDSPISLQRNSAS